MDGYSFVGASGYSGAQTMRRTFLYQRLTKTKVGGASVTSYQTISTVTGILVDASSRTVEIADARGDQVSHELLIEGGAIAKRDDRFVLQGPPQDRFFYVQSFEVMGANRVTSHATMERMS